MGLMIAARKYGYWDVAEPCAPPLCQYHDCRGTFLGQAYRGTNISTGFLPGERCAQVSTTTAAVPFSARRTAVQISVPASFPGKDVPR